MIMNININNNNIAESKYKDVVIAFAKAFQASDTSGLMKTLTKDAIVILYDRSTIVGINAVCDYLKDWVERNGSKFDILVDMAPWYSRPAVFLQTEKGKMIFLFHFVDNKIDKIVLSPQSFTRVGFGTNDYPYTVEYVRANAKKEIAPLDNHYFCPICGRHSNELNWYEGIFFKAKGSSKDVGLLVFASICPHCNRSVELCPDMNSKYVVSVTQSQKEKLAAMQTEEERDQYVNGIIGDMRPINQYIVPHKTNALSRFGKESHDFLRNVVVKENKPYSIFEKLDELHLVGDNLKLHIATSHTREIGDTSYFVFNDTERARATDVFANIKTQPSEKSAWQIYLLYTAYAVMPVFWHGAYDLRKFIFDEADLNDIPPLRYTDLQILSIDNLLLPRVEMTSDKKEASIYCTYWNEWQGLVREHIVLSFNEDETTSLEKEEFNILYKYDCGICF
jgi:hypothetical protein